MNNWFETEMTRAEEHIAQHGYQNADMKDVMMVGFKYLGERNSIIRIQLRGKVLFPVGTLVGGILVGATSFLLKFVV